MLLSYGASEPLCFPPGVKYFYSNPDVYQAIRCDLGDIRMGVNPVLPEGMTGQLVTRKRPAASQKIIYITSHPLFGLSVGEDFHLT